MKRNLQVFCAIFSGFIIAAAIPNEYLLFGSPLLGLVALIPIYLALSDSRTPRWSGFLICIYMFTQHMLSSYWLGYFKDFAIFTLGASAIGTAAIGWITGGTIHLAFTGNGRLSPQGLQGFSRLREHSGLRPFALPVRVILFASLWTLLEWVKSNGFLAYPWGTLVMTAYRWKLLSQIVDITGTWGISFLFAMFSAVIAEGLLILRSRPFSSNKSWRHTEAGAYAQTAAFCLALFICGAIYGFFQYTKSRPAEKTVSVLVTQSNANSWTSDNELMAITNSQKLTEQAILENEKKPDLIVWNESVITSFCFPEAQAFYIRYPDDNPLIPFIDKIDIPFIIGGSYLIDWSETGRPQVANSSLYFDRDGTFSDWYGKMHLVPFAEYIPFSESRIVQKVLNSIIGFSDGWTPGTNPEVFTIPLKDGTTVKAGAPVCFDDAFPSVCGKLFNAGADMLVNITNDSWSSTDSAEYQHFVIASFRAIEYRIPLIRSATAGYSVVVEPSGRISASLPLFTEGALFAEIPIAKREYTIYSRLGDWLPWTLIVLSLLYGFYFAISEQRLFKSLADSSQKSYAASLPQQVPTTDDCL